jgi:Asp-tRNA(Asn)/Glu-tRNA(Gln) amidotransferase A subunit family amidase
MRFLVKDNFALSGIQTYLQSTMFAKTYDIEKHTASLIDRLLQLGATVVGKAKMIPFATAGDPNDWPRDFCCPFNPRGDGQLHPGGSSTGSAAAIASYPWLDFALGTDSKFSCKANNDHCLILS